MQRNFALRCALLFSATLLLGLPAHALTPDQSARRPNIVLLLVDDAGLMDFSAYGGEARMPTINALASSGVRFDNYHSSPLCAPSRAMLLTGMDNHRTGMATIPEVVRDEDRDKPGYSMHLEAGVHTVADRLRASGYRTYMTGKWHLGSAEGELPVHHGFDRSFILDASGADNWEQKSYMPYYAYAPWFEDDAPADLPADFYSSEFLVDKMIDYIGGAETNQQNDKPFFAHIGFQAIHIPIQAPAEFTANYAGVYAEGWDVLRRNRWQRAQDLELIPRGAPYAERPEGMRAWASLPATEQAFFAKSMAVNSGMLEAMDFHIGRLVQHLKDTGQFANTLFIVTSDNGPAGSNPAGNPVVEYWLESNGYHRDIDRLGEFGSMAFIGPEWANAAAAPGDLHKFYAAEGGIHVPLIISGPTVPARAPVKSLAMVTDITPTILDYAGTSTLAKEATRPDGKSLREVVENRSPVTHAKTTPIGMEVSGNSALFLGDYKLTRNSLPLGDGRWRLFNLATDPGETNDLTTTEPERFAILQAAYHTYAQEFGVIELGAQFDVQQQLLGNIVAELAGRYWWQLILIALALLGLLALLVSLVRYSLARRLSR